MPDFRDVRSTRAEVAASSTLGAALVAALSLGAVRASATPVEAGCPTTPPPADTSAHAQTAYFGLTHQSTLACPAADDAMPINFDVRLGSGFSTDDFYIWVDGAWQEATCAVFTPAGNAAAGEGYTVTLFFDYVDDTGTGEVPAPGEQLAVCHASLDKAVGGTTGAGVVYSRPWCDAEGTPAPGQGLEILDAWEMVPILSACDDVPGTSWWGIKVRFSGGPADDGDANWGLSWVQGGSPDRLQVLDSSDDPIQIRALRDSDNDNYIELCIAEADADWSDVARIVMQPGAAYDPNGCPNGSESEWVK